MRRTKYTTTGKSQARRGGALVFAMLVLSSLMMLSAAFHTISTRTQRELSSDLDQKRAHSIAQAALAEAMTAIRGGKTGNVGSQAAPAYLAGGMFWVVATPDLPDNRTRLLATALAGQGRASLESIVQDNGQDSLFAAVLNSREQLTLNSSVVIDSYVSADGTYADQAVNTTNGHTHAGVNGHVSSNMDIVANADATVLGDATPGPGHLVSLASGAYVSGSTTPAATPFVFPPIEAPAVIASGNYGLGPNATGTLPSGDYGYGSFSIGKGATLTIEGPANIVVDDFTGGKDGNLMIDATNGPVTFYVQNSYSHISGFETDAVAGSPMGVAFMVSAAQDVVFPSGTNIRGAFYAPESNIIFAANNEAWGAFAGNRVDMSNAMKFHFDESLQDYWDSDAGQGEDNLQVTYRRTVAFSVPALKNDRRDPFMIMGLDSDDLLSPADAWDN